MSVYKNRCCDLNRAREREREKVRIKFVNRFRGCKIYNYLSSKIAVRENIFHIQIIKIKYDFLHRCVFLSIDFTMLQFSTSMSRLCVFFFLFFLENLMLRMMQHCMVYRCNIVSVQTVIIFVTVSLYEVPCCVVFDVTLLCDFILPVDRFSVLSYCLFVFFFSFLFFLGILYLCAYNIIQSNFGHMSPLMVELNISLNIHSFWPFGILANNLHNYCVFSSI